MARYIVPAEMPKSCAHCHFSVLKYQHPFFSKEKPNTKGYFCPFADLTLELDFYDYTTKADWCPLVGIEDTADVVPKSEVAREIFEEIDELIFQHGRGDLADKYFYLAMNELKKKYTEGKDDG